MDVKAIVPPVTCRPLIIEGVGGILVPLTDKQLTIDLFQSWNAKWVIVSRNYLGSINHTLLTIEVLKARKIDVAGIIFNGKEYPEGEKAILDISGLPFLARVHEEDAIDRETVKRYALEWNFWEQER